MCLVHGLINTFIRAISLRLGKAMGFLGVKQASIQYFRKMRFCKSHLAQMHLNGKVGLEIWAVMLDDVLHCQQASALYIISAHINVGVRCVEGCMSGACL